MVSCDGDALVRSVIDPLEALAEVGVNTALKFRLAPAAIVVEAESPLMLNPEPVTLTCENVSVAVPLFVSVIGCELLSPTMTLPKLTLAGLAEISACAPVPLNASTVGDPDALLVIDTLPGALPVAVGANVTVKVLLASGLIVAGAVRLIVYPGPVMLAAVMFRAALPELVSVTVCVALLPTLTLLKATDDGLSVIWACVAVAEPLKLI
jgi:hypothetical protein